jgi:hypothetical protein
MAEEVSYHMNQLVVFAEAFTRILGFIMYIRCHMSIEDAVVSVIKLRACDILLRLPVIS